MKITNRMLVENALAAARNGTLAAVVEGADANGYSYRDRDAYGCTCAIGASLPPSVLDHLEEECFNSQPINSVPWEALGVEFEDIKFAQDLQIAHDWFGEGDLPSSFELKRIDRSIVAMSFYSDGSPEEMIAFLETLQKTIETAA